MAGNLYKAAFSTFTSVSPEIETLLQDLTATTALADEATTALGAASVHRLPSDHGICAKTT
jgi:hypothetical protein